MDYYKNGTLLDYFEKAGRAPEPVAYEWFAQLCSALEYLHDRRFAHRDVKMDNVLLDHRWRIRLADFGMCVAVERPTRVGRYRPCGRDDGGDREDRRTRFLRSSGRGDDDVKPRPVVNSSICGSLHYMSPELLANGPYHGQLADVWAAGVLLFCLVVGRFPYNGCDVKEVDGDGKPWVYRQSVAQQVLKFEGGRTRAPPDNCEQLVSEGLLTFFLGFFFVGGGLCAKKKCCT